MTDLWTIVVLLLKYHLPYFRTTIYDLIIWEDYPVSNISAQLSSGVLSRCISSRRTYDHSRFIYFCCCCCYYVYLAFSRPFTFFSVYIIFSWSTRFIITRKRGGGNVTSPSSSICLFPPGEFHAIITVCYLSSWWLTAMNLSSSEKHIPFFCT